MCSSQEINSAIINPDALGGPALARYPGADVFIANPREKAERLNALSGRGVHCTNSPPSVERWQLAAGASNPCLLYGQYTQRSRPPLANNTHIIVESDSVVTKALFYYPVFGFIVTP